ncbi:MAG: tryptophan 7-halogenase [Pseudonocardiaceae bacterium]
MSRTVHCDVAIVGAGPAGAATALALSTLDVGRVVLLAQSTAGDRSPIGESIPPESRLLLERLGVWQAFLADGHDSCLGTCSSWGATTLGYNDFLFNPHGTGWHLDRARFNACLVEQAVAKGTELHVPARVRGVRRTPGGGCTLHTGADGGELHARFVVDATGQAAQIGRALGARRRILHRLSCAAAFLSGPTEGGLGRLAMLEAVDYGWWYAARLPGGRTGALVATDPATLQEKSLHAGDCWISHLQQTRHLARALDRATLDDARIHVRAAPSTVLEPCADDGWAAVGDAACAFDPLLAQGIYKALLDGLGAAVAIAQWLQGRPGDLADYRSAMAARLDEYRINRGYFYRLEQRWPYAPFWQEQRSSDDVASETA